MVFDIEERTAFILDSLQEANIARRRMKVQEIVSQITNSMLGHSVFFALGNALILLFPSFCM